MNGQMDRLDSTFPNFFMHTHTQCPPKVGMCTHVCLLLCLAKWSRVSVGTELWGRRHHIISLGNLEWCRDWRRQTVVLSHLLSPILLSKRLDHIRGSLQTEFLYLQRYGHPCTLIFYPPPSTFSGNHPIDGMMKPC